MRILGALLVAASVWIAGPASALASQRLLNSCFDQGADAVTGVASSWTNVTYPGQSAAAAYSIVAPGSQGCPSAQRIDVTSIGAGSVQMAQTVALRAGNTYQFVVWLSADKAGTTAVVHLQRASGSGALQVATSGKVSLTTTPTPYVVPAVVTADVTVKAAIGIWSVGAVTVGKATLLEVPTTRSVPATLVDRRFFGLHAKGFESNLLRDPNFDAPFDPVAAFGTTTLTGSIARFWQENSSGGGISIAYARDTSEKPPGLAASQRVAIAALTKITPGDVPTMRLVQQLSVAPRRTYRFAVLLKGTPGKAVALEAIDDLPVDGRSYASYGSTSCPLTSNWTWCRLEVTIAPSDPSLTGAGALQLIISTDTVQTFWIGRAKFVDAATGTAVVDHVPWPSAPGYDGRTVGQGTTIRLWDSGTTWRDLQPQRGANGWNFKVLDAWVAAANARGDEVVLTLGQTPIWASAGCDASDPNAVTCKPAIAGCGVPAQGPGAASPPADLEDWKTYVRTLATRYDGGAHGRIRWWEIWNEPGDCTFYDGTQARLAELTVAAAAELKKVDPTHRVISPGFALFPGGADPSNYSDAFAVVDEFLAALGSNRTAIDVLGVHVYANQPEAAASVLATARARAKAFRADLAFWETEGASAALVPTDEGRAAILARRFLVDLVSGPERFVWYVWGPEGIVCPDPDADLTLKCVGTVDVSTPDMAPDAAGRALGVLESWLIGRRVTGATIDRNGTWRVLLRTPAGERSAVVWNPAATKKTTLPYGLSVTQRVSLAGEVTDLGSSTSVVTVTPAPVLYR